MSQDPQNGHTEWVDHSVEPWAHRNRGLATLIYFVAVIMVIPI